jgi:hypothetical protein
MSYCAEGSAGDRIAQHDAFCSPDSLAVAVAIGQSPSCGRAPYVLYVP